ncbi:hypothetical protein CP533_4281 [Ophiocordyceps camponoti-saundersi (nom. inval.)]|nr:hypothetical protein CP533_4281 [Ophiocordyceps camponoti-saundersi (nom. inval.)]
MLTPGSTNHNEDAKSQGRALQPVAELAQLKSQTLFCLPRPEPSVSSVVAPKVEFGFRGAAIVYRNGPGPHQAAGRRGNDPTNVDIDSLLKQPDDSDESPGGININRPPVPVSSRPTASSPAASHRPPPQQQPPPPQPPPPSVAAFARAAHPPPPPPPSNPPPVVVPAIVSARRAMGPQLLEQPVKKQSKWSPEEDALIIELRGSGMKWEDVSKRLPGRSAISCRLHYQNYLERRSEWDEERKNKLARLYERFKSEMWAKVAEELAVPWRAAEAMHWQLGEADMARRAGVVPFSLAAVNVESGQQRGTVSRPASHYQEARHLTPPSPRSMYTRAVMASGGQQQSSSMASQPPPPPPPPPPPGPPPSGPQSSSSSTTGLPMSVMSEQAELYYTAGPGLAPIQTLGQPRNPGPLPSLAELTTGVSPYAAAGGSSSSSSGGVAANMMVVEQRPRSGPRGGGGGVGVGPVHNPSGLSSSSAVMAQGFPPPPPESARAKRRPNIW